MSSMFLSALAMLISPIHGPRTTSDGVQFGGRVNGWWVSSRAKRIARHRATPPRRRRGRGRKCGWRRFGRSISTVGTTGQQGVAPLYEEATSGVVVWPGRGDSRGTADDAEELLAQLGLRDIRVGECGHQLVHRPRAEPRVT